MAKYGYKIVFGSKLTFYVDASSEKEAALKGYQAWVDSEVNLHLDTYWVDSTLVFECDPPSEKGKL